MALAFSTVRDEVALNLQGRVYANLTTAQQATIDGAGARALNQIQRYADYVDFTGNTAAPDEWTAWLCALASAFAAQHMSKDRVAQLEREAADALSTALRSFSKTVSTGTTLGDVGLTVIALRKYVIARCVNREPIVLPSFDVVDQAIREMILAVWSQADLSHARYRLKLTIGTDSAVTAATLDATPVALALDRITTDILYFDDDDAVCRRTDKEAVMRERSDTTRTTGRPELFIVRNTASGLDWEFAPEPDKQYTAIAEGVIKAPDLTTYAELNTALALFPTDFGPPLQRAVVGRVMFDLGVTGGAAMHREGQDAIDRIIPLVNEPAGEPGKPQPVLRRRGLGQRPRRMGGFV